MGEDPHERLGAILTDGVSSLTEFVAEKSRAPPPLSCFLSHVSPASQLPSAVCRERKQTEAFTRSRRWCRASCTVCRTMSQINTPLFSINYPASGIPLRQHRQTKTEHYLKLHTKSILNGLCPKCKRQNFKTRRNIRRLL